MARKVSPPNGPIAIVGCACRFAGDANNPSKLWELLRDPKDIRKEVPESRFNINGYYHPDYAHLGHANVKESYLCVNLNVCRVCVEI
jgi:acyl transferase domain-containing protein